MPTEISAEAKDQKEAGELAQEIQDLDFNHSFQAAVAQRDSANSYLYSMEYEIQKEDVQLSVDFADIRLPQQSCADRASVDIDRSSIGSGHSSLVLPACLLQGDV